MNEEASTAGALRAAAIIDDGSCDVDALLATVAGRQRRAGRTVRGLLMTNPEGQQGCACEMVLVDIGTQEQYLVSQPLGPQSNACRADPDGFARASAVLRRAVLEQPDLVVVNRFGGLEAAGQGFRAELLELMSRDLPLLTVVATGRIDAWRDFTGHAAPLLAATPEAIGRWLALALGPEPS